MNFNSFVNNLSWKKLILIIVGVVIVGWLVREVMFWTFFHETKQMFNQFNKQFTEQQKDIQKTISDSDNEFVARNKNFNDLSKNFNQGFDELQNKNAATWEKIENERAVREAAFDKEFEEAPKKMWDHHEKMAKMMRDGFIKDSKQMHKDFQGNEANVTKLKECTKKLAVIGFLKDGLPESENITSEQRKSRDQTILLIRQEIAKAERCVSSL